MFCLDQASQLFPFAANMFNQMGYAYTPGDEMSDEDEEQIYCDLRAIAEYGAPMTAPHGFVYTDEMVEFFDLNADDIYRVILNCDEDIYIEELEGSFNLTRYEAESVENGCPSDWVKIKIVQRLLEVIANYCCFDTDAQMC